MMSPSAMAKMQTDRLDQAVKLTPEQKTKVQAIYEKAATAMQAARQSGDTSSMRQIMTKEQADVKAVLTPEQQKESGLTPDLIRLSVGIEHIDDILSALEEGIAQA